jgi:ABC-2 type transport system ATP-binding protein
MTAVVKAESLTKRFGEVSAVTDLSFALEAGTITGFLGLTAPPRRRRCG